VNGFVLGFCCGALCALLFAMNAVNGSIGQGELIIRGDLREVCKAYGS
jgi:hypothetical protein